MRHIRSLASWILLPAVIGLACAFAWYLLTERWAMHPAAVIGLALVSGAIAHVVDVACRRAVGSFRRRRLPAVQPRHRKEPA
jgi:hypothetical protein